MKQELKEIEINGILYVRKDTINSFQESEKLDGMPYVIIRTYSAGVHVGYLEKREGKECILRNTRRIHYWDGAASLSQMALNGVSKPKNCRFSVIIDKIELIECIEILYCTKEAQENIQGVFVWKI